MLHLSAVTADGDASRKNNNDLRGASNTITVFVRKITENIGMGKRHSSCESNLQYEQSQASAKRFELAMGCLFKNGRSHRCLLGEVFMRECIESREFIRKMYIKQLTILIPGVFAYCMSLLSYQSRHFSNITSNPLWRAKRASSVPAHQCLSRQKL